MHNNYYFLKHLSARLSEPLCGAELAECFSQNKDELILGFVTGENTFWIKALLSPAFCCLSFPEQFHRAGKNSTDIFKQVLYRKVIGIDQHLNERAFSIRLSDSYQLIFKMHGNRSNILLAHGDQVIDVFNHRLKKDYEIVPSALDRLIDPSFDQYQNPESLSVLFPTFGKEVLHHLNQAAFSGKSRQRQWESIREMINTFDRSQYYVSGERLALLPFDGATIYDDPLAAINAFYRSYIADFHLNKEKKAILKQLTEGIRKGRNYIRKSSQKLAAMTSVAHHRAFGDLLMANLHKIPSNTSEVVLENFYDHNKPVAIPLKKRLNAQQNAAIYYKKAKNQSIEIDNLKANIASKQRQTDSWSAHIRQIETLNDYKKLKQYLKENDLIKTIDRESIRLPYHVFSWEGFTVWVGKNAKANDALLQNAHKDDLWLHAKDVKGSHVLVKHQAGKPVPGSVKKTAAQVAAYYSRRKTDSLCPVIVTPRKFVRKRKGAPAGSVVVDKEVEVVLVEPHKPEESNLRNS